MIAGTLPLPVEQAILDGQVIRTFGRLFCAEHDGAALIEASSADLADRPGQISTVWRCSAPSCRLEVMS